MKDKFHRTYDELYDIYPEFNFLNRFASYNNIMFRRLNSEYREFFLKEELFIESVKREIMEFEFEKRFPFRPDAKYFLLTSFHSMIIKPLLYQVQNEDTEISEKLISELIKSDIKTIMINSLDYKKEDKISGHDILKSIDTLWPQLQSTKMELWG